MKGILSSIYRGVHSACSIPRRCEISKPACFLFISYVLAERWRLTGHPPFDWAQPQCRLEPHRLIVLDRESNLNKGES